LHQIAIAGNNDNIGELFSFKGKWFTPCGHKAQTIYSDAQISWRIGFSYTKTRMVILKWVYDHCYKRKKKVSEVITAEINTTLEQTYHTQAGELQHS
jgi:hypothetical protein